MKLLNMIFKWPGIRGGIEGGLYSNMSMTGEQIAELLIENIYWFFGIFGLAMLIGSPAYLIYTIKKRRPDIGPCFAIFIFGMAFTWVFFNWG